MLLRVILNTNRKIEEFIESFPSVNKYLYKSYVRTVDMIELRAFIGLYGLVNHDRSIWTSCF